MILREMLCIMKVQSSLSATIIQSFSKYLGIVSASESHIIYRQCKCN